MTERLLTPKEVARELGVTERTLARWRAAGFGPVWCRVGPRLVRYDRESVRSYGPGEAALHSIAAQAWDEPLPFGGAA
jgi:predicted DNA-binding transcriptional regulator AlpA